jgi:hypothetical protein
VANGFAALDAQIARLQAVGDLPRRAAPAAAEAVEDELRRQIRAGVDPQGASWKPREEDGGKPLRNAAQALAVVPIGTTVLARLKGPEARHHKGTAKGGTIRRILPVSGLPLPWARAIKRALVEEFEQTMGVR